MGRRRRARTWRQNERRYARLRRCYGRLVQRPGTSISVGIRGAVGGGREGG